MAVCLRFSFFVGRAGALLVGGVGVADVPAVNAAAAGPERPDVAKTRERSVGGRALPSVARSQGAESRYAVSPGSSRAAKPWPSPGSSVIDLAGQSGLRTAAGLPAEVRVGRAAKDGVTIARVDALTGSNVVAMGGVGEGLAVRVRRADGIAQPGKVTVAVDYSGFRDVYGGGLAGRLRLAKLPGACALRPAERVCGRPQWVPGMRNDLAAGALTAEIDAEPAPPGGAGSAADSATESPVAGDAPVYVVTAAAVGSAGDFRATDLKPTGLWQAGQSGGEFTYSYPVPQAPTLAGDGIDLALSYSSASVDGVGHGTNNQSWAGLGWELNPGFIERRYRSCSQDAAGKDLDQVSWGDLCWESPDENDGEADTTDMRNSELTISLDGRSSRLVRDRVSGAYKTEQDFGWKIEYLASPESGYMSWRVTTQEGDVYRFGYRRDAVLRVPHAGDDPGEPCHSSYNGLCYAPYRWNLDQVVDSDENVTDLVWQRWTNHYKNYPTGNIKEYDRGAMLSSIESGSNTQVPGSKPTSRTVFTSVYRCVDRTARDDPLANPYVTEPCPTPSRSTGSDIYPDVPTDMECGSSSCDRYGPTFWITRMLDSITAYSWDPAGNAWTPVSKLQLRYKYIDPPGLTEKVLWLEYIRPVGLAGGEIRLPPVDFDAVQLNGVVDYQEGSPGYVAKMNVPRISAVKNGFGGRTEVTYGRTKPCPDAGMDGAGFWPWHDAQASRWDRNGYDCYRQWEHPDGGEGDWRYHHKYLATQVVEKDLVGGSPDQVTSYEYLGKPAWAKAISYIGKASEQSWSEFRGYGQVRTSKGAGTDPSQYSVSSATFFRGMYHDVYSNNTKKQTTVTDYAGNVVNDDKALQAMPLEARTWTMTSYDANLANRSYAEVESQRFGYWQHPAGDGPGVWDPVMARPSQLRRREVLADGSFREGGTDISYDSYGLPVQVVGHGQLGVTTDDTCTTTSYARNTDAGQYLISYPSVMEKHQGPVCVGAQAGPIIDGIITLYDGGGDPATNKPSDGKETEKRAWVDATTVSTTKIAYDEYGRATSVTDPLGKTTTTTYTPAANWPTGGIVTANPLGHTLTEWKSPLHGQVVGLRDANNRDANIDYDALGRTTMFWSAGQPRSGGTPASKVEYAITYDGGIGQPTAAAKTTTSKLLSGTGSSARWLTTVGFDDGNGRGREIQTPSPWGGRIVQVTTYDARGLTAGSSGPAHNGDPAGSGMLNPNPADLDQWSVPVYDGPGRTTAEILYSRGSEVRRTRTAYPGPDRHEVIPPVGAKKVYHTDYHRKVTKVEEWADGIAHADTAYQHDIDGNLTKITDANGNVRTFSYDWAGQRTGSVDPDAGASTTGYDLAGRAVYATDGKGQKITHNYDDLGRRTAQWVGDIGSGTRLAEWVYDTVAKGQLTSAVRWYGSKAYVTAVTGYDADSRPTGSKITIPGEEGVLAGEYTYEQSYNAAGMVTQSTMPAAGGLPAERLDHWVTDTGQVHSLHSDYGGGTTYVKQTDYSLTGRLAARRYGQRGQIKRAVAWHVATDDLFIVNTQTGADTSTPTTVQDDWLFWDASSNLTRITDATKATGTPDKWQSECFTYDGLNRLREAWTTVNYDCPEGIGGTDNAGTDPYKQTFGYDAVGNITQASRDGEVRTYSYPTPAPGAVRPNAVTSISRIGGADRYSYDANGDMTARTVVGKNSTLEWNELGQLHRAVEDGQATHMVYDADGNRIIRRTPTATTLYLPGMELEIAAGTVTAKRYYTSGEAVVAVRETGKPSVSWLLSDAQSSQQLAIDGWTGAVQRQRYLPYGSRRGGRDDIAVTDRGFLGRTEDDATGLVHLGARFYDASIGKFISPDPLIDLRQPQRTNAYGYAANNPKTFSDPDGLMPACDTPRECSNNASDLHVTGKPKSAYYKARNPTTAQQRARGDFRNHRRPQARPKGLLGWVIKKVAPLATPAYRWLNEHENVRDFALGAITTARQYTGISGLVIGWIIPDDELFAMYGADPFSGAAQAGRWTTHVVAAIASLPAGGAVTVAKGGATATSTAARVAASCATNSFLPGTKVTMADGTGKPIEDVDLGDQVVATDPETGTTEAKPVVAIITGVGSKNLVEVTIDVDGDRGPRTARVTATDHHPFWVADRNAWLDAIDLKPGMWLRTSAGTHVQISAARAYKQTRTVHNLTVEDIHTYHVVAGGQDLLVHNCKGSVASLFNVPKGRAGVYTIHFTDGSKYVGMSLRSIYARINRAFTDPKHAVRAAHKAAADVSSVTYTTFRGTGRNIARRVEQEVMDVYRSMGHSLLNRRNEHS